jgi:hypothetical protein
MDELTTRLAEALKIADHDMNTRGYNPYGPTRRIIRDAIASYTAALAAEREAHEQATAKLLGVDDNGQFGVGV